MTSSGWNRLAIILRNFRFSSNIRKYKIKYLIKCVIVLQRFHLCSSLSGSLPIFWTLAQIEDDVMIQQFWPATRGASLRTHNSCSLGVGVIIGFIWTAFACSSALIIRVCLECNNIIIRRLCNVSNKHPHWSGTNTATWQPRVCQKSSPAVYF